MARRRSDSGPPSRFRYRSRPLGGRSPLAALRRALPSLPSLGPDPRTRPGLRHSYGLGLELSRDLLTLAVLALAVRLTLTGAFVAVVSSELLLVLAFNTLVTVPVMYRLGRRLGWIDGATLPDLGSRSSVGDDSGTERL